MSAETAEEAKLMHLTDFSDRLSPMLVKELRQGMRTHIFTIAFILLQAFMILCVLIGASSPGETGAVTGFFWFFIIVALLVVMPIRGFSALNSEVQLNTMDLIHLTQLGAWRITFGKWAAIMAQTLLLTCGILPYLVMRYFFGGVDLIQEIWMVFWTLLASMVLTAITVAFSAFHSILLRAAVAIGIGIGSIILFSAGIQFVTFRSMTSMGGPFGSGVDLLTGIIILICVSVFLIFFLLDMGASRIAPDAENFATRKRLMGLAVGGGLLLLPFLGPDEGMCIAFGASILGLVCLDAITERASLVPSVLLPFARRIFVRPWAVLLTPGWHTGMLYFLLCFALVIGAFLFWAVSPIDDLESWQVAVSLGGMLIFPLVILQLFFSKAVQGQSFFGLYVLIQCCVAVLGFFLFIVAEETPIGEVAYLICPMPFVTFMAAVNNDEEVVFLGFAIGFVVLAAVLTLWRGWPLFRSGRQIMKALREESEG